MIRAYAITRGLTATAADWYHGTPSEPFSRFDLSRERENMEENGNVRQWNSRIGPHFTTVHEVADDVASQDGAGHVMHVDLDMKNPKRYASEFDLDEEGRQWALKHGHTGYGLDQTPQHPSHVAGSLNHHPKSQEIADTFKEHLRSQGYDGITYGNEYEGPKGHLSAIAFHPDDVHIRDTHPAGDITCREWSAGKHPVQTATAFFRHASWSGDGEHSDRTQRALDLAEGDWHTRRQYLAEDHMNQHLVDAEANHLAHIGHAQRTADKVADAENLPRIKVIHYAGDPSVAGRGTAPDGTPVIALGDDAMKHTTLLHELTHHKRQPADDDPDHAANGFYGDYLGMLQRHHPDTDAWKHLMDSNKLAVAYMRNNPDSFPARTATAFFRQATTVSEPDKLYRGLSVVLPPDKHRFVHDPDQPLPARAHLLLSELRKQTPHIDNETLTGGTGGLGEFWTRQPRVSGDAVAYQQENSTSGEPSTVITLHSQHPGDEHYWQEMAGYPDHPGNWRVPLQPGAPLDVQGITWGEPDGPQQHYDFSHPVEKHAGLTAFFHQAAEHPDGPFYHGTAHEFQPGDYVDPSYELGGRKGNSHAFMTSDPEVAHNYGQHKAWARSMFEDGVEGRAYEVRPTGPIEADDTVDDRFKAWRTRHPMEIIRQVHPSDHDGNSGDKSVTAFFRQVVTDGYTVTTPKEAPDAEAQHGRPAGRAGDPSPRRHGAPAAPRQPQRAARTLRAQAAGEVVRHPELQGDLDSLGGGARHVTSTIDALHKGDTGVTTYPLSYPLEGWHAAITPGGHQVVHRTDPDTGNLHVGYAGHNTAEAEERLGASDGGDTALPVEFHTGAEKDFDKLHPEVQDKALDTIDRLARREPHPNDHGLTGRLNGWRAARADFLNRVTHRYEDDQGNPASAGKASRLFIGHIGPHNYEAAQKRLSSAVTATEYFRQNADVSLTSLAAANQLHTDQGSLRNPRAGDDPNAHEGDWFHGTPHHFREFHFPHQTPPEHHDPMEEFEGGDWDLQLGDPGEDYDGPSGSQHWNTRLGAHFTSDHPVAEQFAGNNGRVMHARLHIKNPKVYDSEFDMDKEAYDHARSKGRFIHPHLDEDDYESSASEFRGDHKANPLDRRGLGGIQTLQLPQHWLRVHPEREHIADDFRNKLIAEGHDGVLYGNEFEKHDGRKAQTAIAFHPHQIEHTVIHRPGTLHEGPEDSERARRLNPAPNQPELPFTATQFFQHTAGVDDDYRMMHKAPGPHESNERWDQHTGADPDDPVQIYRSVQHGVHDINPGDWISINSEYAQQHGRHATDPGKDWPVLTASVPAKHIWTDLNDENEQGYAGPAIRQADFHHPDLGIVSHHDARALEDEHKEDGVHLLSPEPAKEIHTGAAVHLTPEDHAFVHDKTKPIAERAQRLYDNVPLKAHAFNEDHDDPDDAAMDADGDAIPLHEAQAHPHPPTHVVLHGHEGESDHSGISWAEGVHDPDTEYDPDYSDYEHHTFSQQHTATAFFREASGVDTGYRIDHIAPGEKTGIPYHQHTGRGPDDHVDIYRAVPRDVRAINKGDWVSTHGDWTQERADSDPGLHVIHARVPAKHVYVDRTDQDDDEAGYQGHHLTGPDVHPYNGTGSFWDQGRLFESSRRTFQAMLQAEARAKQFDDGIMVALVPPQQVAEQIVQEGGQPVDDLHITLAYLGSTGDYTKEELAWLPELVGSWAARQKPLQIRVGGVGKFTNGGKGEHVLYAAPDIPGGAQAHSSLAAFLTGHGYKLPSEHGWTPHMTLAYVDKHFRFMPHLPEHDWTADHVVTFVGTKQTPARLGTGAP